MVKASFRLPGGTGSCPGTCISNTPCPILGEAPHADSANLCSSIPEIVSSRASFSSGHCPANCYPKVIGWNPRSWISTDFPWKKVGFQQQYQKLECSPTACATDSFSSSYTQFSIRQAIHYGAREATNSNWVNSNDFMFLLFRTSGCIFILHMLLPNN